MSPQAWATLAIIVILFGLLIWDRFPVWAVFAGALAAILTLRLAPESQALSGFANSGVLAVIVLFVVAEGMYRTGAISLIIGRIVGQPSSERSANLRLLPLTAGASAFLNNTPIVAMLVPVIGDLGRSARLAVAKIYMAVSFASVLGGATTLIGTSSNLIIAGLVLASYGKQLSIFFPTAVGVPAAVVGVLFLLLVADRLLGSRANTAEETPSAASLYRAEYLVPERSGLVGSTLARGGLAHRSGARLAAVTRAGRVETAPPDDWQLAAGDVLTYEATITAVGDLWTTLGLAAANPPVATGREPAQRLGEGVVAVDAPVVGRMVRDIDLGSRRIVAVSRSGAAPATAIADTVVAAGDNVVVQADPDDFDRPTEAFALGHVMHGYRVQRTDRAIAAAVIVVAMVAIAAFGVMSMLNAALLAAAAMIATGCLSFRSAFRSIDWETYVTLACAVGLEPAMTSSGLADAIATALTRIGGGSIPVAVTVAFVGTIVLTNLVTNSAAAALMFPISVGIASSLGAAWEPFVLVVMLGASYAFINPAGYQTHLMVMKPGGYVFGDFPRVGVILTILLGVVVIPLSLLLYAR